MDQHAVPQDITNFKFKLVGDMTFKQFGELAAGAMLAYLFYLSGLHPILRWPLVTFFALFGLALAFLPIEERPLDVWLINFIRSLYHPTLYLWANNTGCSRPALPAFPPFLSDTPAILPRLQTLPPPETVTVAPPDKPPAPSTTLGAAPSLSVDELEKLRQDRMAELNTVQKQLEKMTTEIKGDIYKARTGTVSVDTLTQMRDEKLLSANLRAENLIRQNRALGTKIETIKTRIQALAGMDTTQLKIQLENLLKQKEEIDSKITAIEETEARRPMRPITAPASTVASDSQVKIVDKPVMRQSTISLTDVPNIINGLIVNDRGVPLENTILVIKDQAGNSLRALKTNQIGQFIASTPLENGTYYLEFERPNYKFSVLEVTLTGQVLSSLNIEGQTETVTASAAT